MKAGETSFLKLLDGKKQFVIPIYQRTYSWERPQCAQLWQDILRTADPQIEGHFVGSIVFIQDGLYTSGGTNELLVIDGQQRLTTLTVLLIALARAVAAAGGQFAVSHDEIYDYYLTNRHGKDDEHYKLLLTRSDKQTLTNLVDSPDIRGLWELRASSTVIATSRNSSGGLAPISTRYTRD